MYKQILIAVDGSEESEQVLPRVRSLALPEGASAVLLHVCPEPELVVAEGGTVISYVDQEEARLRQKAIAYLEWVARGLETAAVSAKTLVRFGDPVERILETAREIGADMIALATRAPRTRPPRPRQRRDRRPAPGGGARAPAPRGAAGGGGVEERGKRPKG